MKKRIFKKPLRASSTFQDNLDDELLVETNDTVLLNHQNFGDILVDPDSDMPEDTHKPLFAGLRRKSQVKAAAEDVLLDDDEDLLLDDMPQTV